MAQQFPEVAHGTELFDALLGKVVMAPEKFQIVLVLNEYGDFLSDMACGLAGSLGIGASANLGFDPAAVVRVALFDAAHGTAPDIAGKNLANPTAIFLALAMLLSQIGELDAGLALKTTTLDLLRQGIRTRDLRARNRPRASPPLSLPRSPVGLRPRSRRPRPETQSRGDYPVPEGRPGTGELSLGICYRLGSRGIPGWWPQAIGRKPFQRRSLSAMGRGRCLRAVSASHIATYGKKA